MTQPEALQEARRRWGTLAYAEDITFFPRMPNFEVGSEKLPTGYVPSFFGFGNSWEAAFADANRRETS